ncbi:MAG: biosynthetic-type acetolactate synthase large subunit [Nitrospinota bacterium]
MEYTGGQIVLEELKAHGVEVVFGIPGGAIMPFYDVLYDSPIRRILNRHEQGATHAADGYARVTGKPGVVVVTSGPGATNTVTGLANALMDSVPLVVLTGQVPTQAIGSDFFQESDIYGISIPVTKHNWLVKDVRKLAGVMREAFRVATHGRPGPVLVDLPKDVQLAKTEYEPPREGMVARVTPAPSAAVEERQLDEVLASIERCERPVIMAGAGVIKGRASEELARFARRSNIPVICTLLGLGAYPGTDPLSLGMPGMHGTAYANYALTETDLLLNLGARFDDRVTGRLERFAPKARVVHVDIDAAELNKRVRTHIPVCGDVKDVLAKLCEGVKRREYAAWHRQIREWRERYPLKYDRDGSLKPQYVIEQIFEATGGDALVVTGVGQHQMWTAQYYLFNEPGSFVTSGGLGTMGYGFPASLGCKVGQPDKEVVVIDGDGSFMMTLVELGTAAQYQIPVKVAIINNGYLGMVRQWQELFFEKRYSGVEYPVVPDFAKIAEGYSVRGYTVSQVDQVRDTLEQALAEPGPVVLDDRVTTEETVGPLVPAGAGNDEMRLGAEGFEE